MEEYLATDRGRKEIELLRKAIDKYRKTQEKYSLDDDKLEQRQDIMYQNVQQIFRHFSIEENEDVIDIEGLRSLLEYLSVHMPSKQFKLYCKELNMTPNFPTVNFEDFYLRKYRQLSFYLIIYEFFWQTFCRSWKRKKIRK